MVIDKKIIEEIAKKVSELESGAEKCVIKTTNDVEKAITAHPKEFVIGAFLGGIVIGLLVSKGNSHN